MTACHTKYYAQELTRRHAADGVDRLSQSLFDASVDLNPHQIEAALVALRHSLQQGVLMADEVGLGKNIEAALVLCRFCAERRRRPLVVCTASLRKQWAQRLSALNRQQRQQRMQRQQRQDIFAVEDEIIERRDALIQALQERLKQTTEEEHLFTLRWTVV